MRLSQLLTANRSGGDDPADLLAHAGYTLRLADGLYNLLPLGHRVLSRISSIVRREMTSVAAQEVAMPLIQPAKLWDHPIGDGVTRAEIFGTQLFRLAGESGDRLVLAPTHEEVATIVAAACIREVRDLPRVIFQIQPRFRDQICPAGAGLLHTREFVMADAYSFHSDRVGLDETYAAIRNAFSAVLSRCGVSAEVVRADTGSMGGEASEEFVASLPGSADIAAVRCAGCGYAASIEIAEFERKSSHAETPLPIEELEAPDAFPAGSADLMGSSTKRLIWVPFVAGGRILLAVILGDLRLNAVKLAKVLARAGLNTTDLHPATAQELTRRGANYDWISLVRTPPSVLVIADNAVRAGANFFIPSTRVGHFLINVNSGRDFRVDMFADLSAAGDGADCSQCGNAMRAIRGIEVGHIFKLGSRYAAAFGAQIEHSGNACPLEMGCYGLGITRLMATIVEQRRDERGIVWPESVAPFLAVLVPLRSDAAARRGAEQLYRKLIAFGLDILLDDSDAAPDEKLRHADLLGIPFTVVLPGDSKDGDIVEIRERSSPETHRVTALQVNALLRSRSG